MPYRSYLFRTSGARLRLRLSQALPFGSTKLVLASTLLLLATHDGQARRMDWQVAAQTNPHGLSSRYNVGYTAGFQIVAAASPISQMPYTLAGTYPYRGRTELPKPVLYRPALRSPGRPYPAGTGPLGVVRRSWSTVKTMFR